MLVVTWQESRRDRLWEAIEDIGASMGHGQEVLERFWIVNNTALEDAGLAIGRWYTIGVDKLWASVGLEEPSESALFR